MESTIICLSETWLQEDDELEINGYKAHFNSVGPSKGIAVYLKDSSFTPTDEMRSETMQLTKIKSKEIEIITVYRSNKGNTSELLEHIINMINDELATVILGDFNICYQTNKRNRISKFLETNGFQQFVEEPTHIRGGHIDHLYFKPAKSFIGSPVIYKYTPYYSDHDAICTLFKRTNSRAKESESEYE